MIVLLLLLIPIFALLWAHHKKRRASFPPGPPSLPLIGNLFDLPKKSEWLTFERWSNLYESDIIYLNVGGTSIVILNTQEAASDLFEKRSSIYSCRPRMPMITELMGWSWAFLFMPYGEQWRTYRKLFRRELHPTLTDRYQPHALKSSHELVQRLVETPEKWRDHVQHFAGSTIVSIAYGIDVLPNGDPLIARAELAVELTADALLPGKYMVNSFPWMKHIPDWFPGAGWKRFATKARKIVYEIARAPLDTVKQRLADGTAVPSIASYALEGLEDPSQEDIVFGAVGTMYVAGTSSIVASLRTFILAMVLYPFVQASAHRELDTVLGKGHLPTFADMDALPYISAILKEVLRWHPVTPLAVPHSLTEEDTYKGYRIPKGSMVFGNVWAMLHDEKDYPDPFSFKPERYYGEDGKLDPEAKDPATAAFGFGRRRCAGTEMALSTLWISIATLLASVEFGPEVDKAGNKVYPEEEYSSGMVHEPAQFACTINAREKARG